MKIKILGFTYFVLSLTVQAQNVGYTISGNVLGTTADKIYLTYSDRLTHQDIKDSAMILNGKFKLTGKVGLPTYSEIVASDHSFGGAFWIENSAMTIRGVAGKSVEIFGSKTQDEMDVFGNAIKGLQKEMSLYRDSASIARGKSDEVAYKRYEAKMKDIADRQYLEIDESLIKKYPHSYYSLNEVWNFAYLNKLHYEDLSKLYNYLDDNLKQTDDGKTLAEHLMKIKNYAVGSTFNFNVCLPDMHGNKISSNDYKGKYLLLTFSAIEEPSYTGEIDARLNLYKKYHSKGLEILDVMVRHDKTTIEEFTNVKNIPWEIVTDKNAWSNYLIKDLSIDHIPVDVLIDPQGTVIASYVFGDDLIRSVDQAFNK
jgi:cytochrome oxidase Cu insertion factor (SCO1/SenC/PrrC family)